MPYPQYILLNSITHPAQVPIFLKDLSYYFSVKRKLSFEKIS